MRFRLSVALAASALPLLAVSVATQQPLDDGDGDGDDSCPTAHLFCIRGTTEEQGCGVTQLVINQIKSAIPGADQEAIVYPAAGITKGDPVPNFPAYLASETVGITSLTIAMQNFFERCPQTPTALLGYSQGAQVVGDVLCGRSIGGLFTFPKTDPIDPKYTAQVKAIVQFGDPSNRPSAVVPWHQGNATAPFGGFFPRTDASLKVCKAYQNQWQSWCDKASDGAGDLFCARGICVKPPPPQTNCSALQIHLEYVQNHGADVAAWVVQQLSSKGGDDSSVDWDL